MDDVWGTVGVYGRICAYMGGTKPVPKPKSKIYRLFFDTKPNPYMPEYARIHPKASLRKTGVNSCFFVRKGMPELAQDDSSLLR